MLKSLLPQELGIPTANLDSASLHGQLAEAVTGIYAGKLLLDGNRPSSLLTALNFHLTSTTSLA